MKKVLATLAVAGLVAAASTASAKSIVNSKHDLSGTVNGNTGYKGRSTQICVYCHAPHNAALSLPLWNRTNPDGALFTLYSGVNMSNVSFKQGFTSDSTSLFCMSCHDGITTMDAIHNAGAVDGDAIVGNRHTAQTGVFNANAISGPANLSRNLSTTHPVNFPVENSGGDLSPVSGGMMSPDAAAVAWLNAKGYTMGKAFPLYKLTGNRTTAGDAKAIECASCHAVHDAEYSPFLRDTMWGSQLCLGCHNK